MMLWRLRLCNYSHHHHHHQKEKEEKKKNRRRHTREVLSVGAQETSCCCCCCCCWSRSLAAGRHGADRKQSRRLRWRGAGRADADTCAWAGSTPPRPLALRQHGEELPSRIETHNHCGRRSSWTRLSTKAVALSDRSIGGTSSSRIFSIAVILSSHSLPGNTGRAVDGVYFISPEYSANDW